MYKSIHIQNFRCFEDTKIEGFEQINLIGGQNNAGKTALLEALYLGFSPSNDTIRNILANRLQADLIYENPDNQPFRHFFYNQNEDESIKIATNEDMVEIQSNYYSENISDETILDAIPEIIGKAALNIVYFRNNEKDKRHFEFKTIDPEEGPVRIQEFFVKMMNKNELNKTSYFSTNSKLKVTSSVYLKIVNEEKKHHLLKAFQTIEKDIEGFEFINNKLLLKRKNEKLIPINLFGDAMNKLCHWILSIIGGETKIILIDEIENGIHHTNQAKFWKMLFDLAKEFDIQVFATSHSAEMIKAFQEVASEHEVKSGYFELGRHAKTNKILGIKTQLDTLGSKLEHKMNFRGE